MWTPPFQCRSTRTHLNHSSETSAWHKTGGIIFNYFPSVMKKHTPFFLYDREEDQSSGRNVLVYKIAGINSVRLVSGFTDVSEPCL